VRLSVRDVLAELKAERLATDAADAPARAALQPELETHLPWFVRVPVGVGAWIATLFLLFFLGAVLRVENALLHVVAGAAIVVGAVYARHNSVSEFRKHAAIATSLAGQGLILAGVSELTDSPRITAALMVVLSLALIVIVHDGLHRFLSTLAAAAGAYIVVLGEHPSSYGFEFVTIALAVIAALVWRYRVEHRNADVAEMLTPAGYALIVALFGTVLAGSVTHLRQLSIDPGAAIRVGRGMTVAVMLLLAYFAWRINDEHRMSGTRAGFAAISGVLVLGLATLSTPGIITGAAVIALAFDRRDRVLLGMGVLFLLVFGSMYYYSLHLTLLEKSGVLAGSGVLLLGIRHRMVRS
jgi:uncharacterized membrane protein